MHIVNVRDLVEDYVRLLTDIKDLEATLRHLGHQLDTKEGRFHAGKDTRHATRLLLKEHDRITTLLNAVQNSELALDPSGTHTNVPEAALPFFYPDADLAK